MAARRIDARRTARRGAALPLTLLALAVLAARPAPGEVAAQEIVVRAGELDAAAVGPGAEVSIPVRVILEGGGGLNVASISLRLRWDPGALEYLGVEGAGFGSLTVNEADATAGLLRIAAYSTTGSTTSFDLARLRFRAAPGAAGPGGTVGVPLHIEVTALGDEGGSSVAAAATAIGCALCVADLLGDVNGDGAVDILDAQQIARQVVGLGVTDAARFPHYADVNADAGADIVDAQQIARCAVGLVVEGGWCDPASCDELVAADSIVLDESYLGLATGDIRQVVARLAREGAAAAWPAGARAAWGLVNPSGALGPVSFGDSAVVIEAVADGEGRLTGRLGAMVSSPTAFRVGAPPAGDFQVELRYLTDVTGPQQAALAAAAERWMGVIVDDVADHPLNVAASSCHPAMDEVVDDLVIFVELVALDGAGGMLGSAGPCYYRTASGLPITGLVRLDVADVDAMLEGGSFEDVITHEIAHVLGLGTLWSEHGLLEGAGGADPYFTGAEAISRFLQVGGDSYSGLPVPVENSGGAGTRDGHWRESVFDNELMTGWINSGANPLSAVTIGSFQDMGYGVDHGAAENYVLTGLSILGAGISRTELRERLLRSPVAVGTDGRPMAPGMQ